MIDLREHFGVWARCGAGPFWKQLDWRGGASGYAQYTFVNPIDGVMISAHDHPSAGGPALAVTVRNAHQVPEDEFEQTLKDQYLWVRRELGDFFTGLAVVYAGMAGRHTPLSFFNQYYKDQTPEYVATGEGHESVGKDEILAATKTLLGALDRSAVALQKIILKAELDEFLESQGILEC